MAIVFRAYSYSRGRAEDYLNVRSELAKLAHGRIDVAAADQDISLLSQALRPSDQASALFATVAPAARRTAHNGAAAERPERRRAIVDLRLIGMRRSAIVQRFAVQALILGAAASLLGILCGTGSR